MANPAYYDFFRKILLQPDASESATSSTLEADSVTDTLTINGGPGVNFNPNAAGDTFDINVDYQLYVPIGSTNIRLQDVNNNLQDITLRAGTGVQVFRESNNQIAISAYGVAESDTLHTVSNRGRITDQDLIMNGLTVGTVISTAGTDGMSAQDARFIGFGTLNNPLQLAPTEREVTTDPYNETFTFSTAAGAGILSYQIGMDPASSNVTAYEFTLEREDPNNPGTWIVIENESLANSGDHIFAANQYAETHAGSVNWRYTVTASGFSTNVEIQGDFTYEVYDVAADPVLETDSAAGNIAVRDVLPAATATYDIGASGNTFANVYADTFTGNLTGNVTGDVTGDLTGNADTATALATGRAIAISGAVTGAGITFDGTGDITINTSFTDGNVSQFTNDSAYITLTSLSATGDISYNNTTGVFSYTAPTNVSAFTNDSAYITLTSLSASGDISYNNTTGVISFTERTDAEVRGLISATGDISYNNTTGVISFTQRTDAEVRGLISATGDISYNNTTGVISFNNTSGYITSYTETDTLDSVTGRGNTTTNSISVAGVTIDTDLSISNNGTDSVISEQGTGMLRVLTSRFQLNTADDVTPMIYATSSGVGLATNGTAVLTTDTVPATGNSGVRIAGDLAVSGITILGDTATDELRLNLATSATDRTNGFTTAPTGFMTISINGTTAYVPYWT